MRVWTVRSRQLISRPRALHFTVADELLALDHLPLIKANGFDLSYAADTPGSLSLTAMPISRDTVFDLSDLEQLVHLIGESGGDTMVRPKKTRAMFAMRACRRSVMIGRVLRRGEMEKLVRNMGTIDQPWVSVLIVPSLAGTDGRIVHMGDPP